MDEMNDSFGKILEDLNSRVHMFTDFDWVNWGKAISNIIYLFADVVAWFKGIW